MTAPQAPHGNKPGSPTQGRSVGGETHKEEREKRVLILSFISGETRSTGILWTGPTFDEKKQKFATGIEEKWPP